MTITNRDQLQDALANNSSRIVIDKTSITSLAAGNFASLWRATGQPGQGVIPAAAAVCDNTLIGAIQFTQQTAPATSYLGWAYFNCGNSAMSVEFHDRLMHMGGLSGTVTTAQPVGIDISGSLATSNLDARKGDSNYSDVQWWLEWYTTTGGTAVTATVAVTYNDGTTGTLTISLAATRPASQMIPLNGFIPAAVAGKYIRAVTSVTLSATTGTAGSFGVTATRLRSVCPMNLANKSEIFDWAQLGLPNIPNSTCMMMIALTSTTSTGAIRGGGKITHG
jgi:hypothetical protein